MSLCAASPTGLASHDFLLCACVFWGGIYLHSLSGVALMLPCLVEATQLLDSLPAVQTSQNKTQCHLSVRAEVIYGPGLWSYSLKLL